MKLRTKYILFIALLQAATLVLSFYVFQDNKILFIFSEIFILISIVLAWQLYKELLRPLKTLMTGIDALKSREFNVKFRPTGKYEMDELIDVYNQMVDQLRVERTKQEEQHFFLEKLIQTSPTGIIILDHNNKIEEINPRAFNILQLKDSIKGKFLSGLNHPILKQISELQSGQSRTLTFEGLNTYKIQMSHFIDRGFPRNFILIEELTAEILAAEKQVYGKVIRMMAHEVNNTIGPVNSIIDSALKSVHWTNNENNTLKDALHIAIERNNNLNGFMRNFADLVKLPPPVKKQVDLNRLVQNVGQLFFLKAEERNILLKYNLANSFMIWADEQQMEQVLINIVKNAVEAIAENGTITFTSDFYKKKLTITDTGKGISEEDADKLFSPFFSTKKDGQGIGLTLVREILVNHDFDFSLKTIDKRMTAFTISLH
ncbi:MAG: sensor histidine kinase [Flavisolibacter sp.]